MHSMDSIKFPEFREKRRINKLKLLTDATNPQISLEISW